MSNVLLFLGSLVNSLSECFHQSNKREWCDGRILEIAKDSERNNVFPGQAKQFLKHKFKSFCTDRVTKEIEKGTNIYLVNIETKLSVVKPLQARWLTSFYDHMQNNHEMIIKAFQMAGITHIAEIEILDEDPFKTLSLHSDIWQIFKVCDILKVIEQKHLFLLV